MVPLVIPGEKVIARVFKNNPNYSEADLVRIITPSPDRIEPPCKYFNQCGGCQYQHMTVNAQREWKRSQVVALLQRIGGLNDVHVNNAVGSENYYGYRSKITPHYDSLKSVADLRKGSRHRTSKRIVDIEKCTITTNTINSRVV